MIAHREALDIAFNQLNKIESVRILTDIERESIDSDVIKVAWEVSTEISNQNVELIPIKLICAFKSDFPLSFPSIYLDADSFDGIKYIPHVDENCLVCTFDNNAKPNPSFPGDVVEIAVRKAKRIIEDGIKGHNKTDFEDEIIAYWENRYSEKDQVLTNVLILAEEPLKKRVKIIFIKQPINGIHSIIHQDEKIALNFKAYLDDHDHFYEESEGLYIGELKKFIEPPFDLTNKKSIEFINEEFPDRLQQFKKYINGKSSPKVIIFSKTLQNKPNYFGWSYINPNLSRKGYREGMISPIIAFSSFEANTNVRRISTEIFNPERLIARSAGSQKNEPNTSIYSIAGVGSIGSNLIHFLKTNQFAEFRMIDNEKLKVENLGRHLLGFEYTNKNKATGVKEFLISNNPTRTVSSKEKSIFNVLEEEPDYINSSDILIVCIGEENIERWISNQLELGILKKPTLFIWVEPYLAGGHCIYLTPNHNIYSKLFDESGLFKFNVIDKQEYLASNPILTLREAGCQSNFTPYSADQILYFLGRIYPYILNLTQEKEAKCFSWVGDIEMLRELNIELSDLGKSWEEGSIIEHKND